MQVSDVSDDFFMEIDSYHTGLICADPAGEYMDSPALPHVDDPIKYWEVYAQTESNPALARMALDFLSVPGMSFLRYFNLFYTY